jgi:hypothetical protein
MKLEFSQQFKKNTISIRFYNSCRRLPETKTSTAARQFDTDLSRARGRKPSPKITWPFRSGVDAADQLLAHHYKINANQPKHQVSEK